MSERGETTKKNGFDDGYTIHICMGIYVCNIKTH